MLNYQETRDLMETVYNDMKELIKTNEAIKERIKTDEVGEIYDLLRSIFFTDDDRCIYNEELRYNYFRRYYANNTKAFIRNQKNKMLGVKTSQPDNFCIGIVLDGKFNYLTGKSFPSIELAPEEGNMTYLSARRKINKMPYNPGSMLRYVIYRIEDNGDYTVMN